MATVMDATQLNQSLPQGRGRCRVATDEDAIFKGLHTHKHQFTVQILICRWDASYEL